MITIYRLTGYFSDSPNSIEEDVFVTDSEDFIELKSGFSDGDVFFYGVSEMKLQQCINRGEQEPLDDCFIVIDYQIEKTIP